MVGTRFLYVAGSNRAGGRKVWWSMTPQANSRTVVPGAVRKRVQDVAVKGAAQLVEALQNRAREVQFNHFLASDVVVQHGNVHPPRRERGAH